MFVAKKKYRGIKNKEPPPGILKITSREPKLKGGKERMLQVAFNLVNMY